jgi:UDP-N-acetylglucosamine 2-epimerase (hydrolysing)
MSPNRPPEGATSGRRRVLFLTGTRADFGKLKPLIARLAADPAFEYQIFATGMHLLSRFGTTVREIYRAGFDVVHPFFNQEGTSGGTPMDLTLANTIHGLSLYVREFPPDMIVVHGDRVETLAGAIVGALNNILVAHVEGGELSGTVDELLRHSVSKLSHLHFVANEESRVRLMQMGEAPGSVFVIGSPDIDVMLSPDLPSLDQVRERYEIPFDDYAVALYHPVTTELDQMEHHAAEVVRGLVAAGTNFVVIHPNNDAGSDAIVRAIGELEGHPRFRLIPSMRFEYFLRLLKHARAMVGNSSAGIREAPVYGVPTVNVGSRQRNRFHHESIINVPEDAAQIAATIASLPAAFPPSLHFGEGRSAEHFHERLRDASLWETPRQKQFRDLPLGETPAAAW